MKHIGMLIGLICAASIIVSCASTEKSENALAQKVKEPPIPADLYGAGPPCWDGSLIFDPNQTCPIPCQDGSSSVWDDIKQEQICPKQPEPTSSSPNENDTCWDGSVRSNENPCIDRPFNPTTGKPTP